MTLRTYGEIAAGFATLDYQWMIVKREGQIAFDADGWGGQSILVIPALDMVIVTKSDAVNPRGRSSYQVLDKILESVVN